MTIEALLPTDWPAVLAIYEEGIDIGTFEELVPTWEEWDRDHLIWPRIGRTLLGRLCEGADAARIWTIQASILAANEASIALHAACGFRYVGVREKLARKRGEWSDVVLMERRSQHVG